MDNLRIGFFSAILILFGISTVSLIWATYDYLGAYEVEETNCQYVKHFTLAHYRYGIDGYVTTCWQVPELEPDRVDGPVTWCTYKSVVSGVTCENVMTQLREKYPITTPPTFFPCYKAISDYKRMFLTKPDLFSWKDKFSIGIFCFLAGLIGMMLWFIDGPSISKIKKD